MIATDIVDLGVLDEGPDVRALQVLQVVVVGGAQLGAHAAVMAGDDHAATARGDLGVDTVLDAQTGLLAGVTQDSSILVFANAAEVDNAVLRQQVLRTAGRVLGGTASNQLGIVVVEEVLIDVLVLRLGKDGVVRLQAVLLKQGLIAKGLDV